MGGFVGFVDLVGVVLLYMYIFWGFFEYFRVSLDTSM